MILALTARPVGFEPLLNLAEGVVLSFDLEVSMFVFGPHMAQPWQETLWSGRSTPLAVDPVRYKNLAHFPASIIFRRLLSDG